MRHAVSMREANFVFARVDHSFNYVLNLTRSTISHSISRSLPLNTPAIQSTGMYTLKISLSNWYFLHMVAHERLM